MSQDAENVQFWKFWLEGVLLPIVGAFGVAGETFYNCPLFFHFHDKFLENL